MIVLSFLPSLFAGIAATPEIDPGVAVSALAVLGGGVLVLTDWIRRKKQSRRTDGTCNPQCSRPVITLAGFFMRRVHHCQHVTQTMRNLPPGWCI
jgi:hypothetical protein